MRLLLLQTGRVRAVMQTSERGEASSRRFGRCLGVGGRDGGSVSIRIQIAASRARTKDRGKIDRRRGLRAGH